MSWGAGVAGAVGDAATGFLGSMWAKRAQKKALKKRMQALKSLEEVDLNTLKAEAATADKENLANRLAAQREVDPGMAALREGGISAILAGLAGDRAGGAGQAALASANSEEIASGEQMSPLVAQLVAKAKEDLDAGATLPPELQAELVRSGLESATANSLGTSGLGVVATNLRKLLGSAGLQLKQQREQSAVAKLSAADALRSSRQSRLSQIAALDESLRSGAQQRGAAAASIGQATLPGGGITGDDAANTYVDKLNFRNNRKLGLANMSGQKNLLNASANIGFLKAGSGLLTDLLGTSLFTKGK